MGNWGKWRIPNKMGRDGAPGVTEVTCAGMKRWLSLALLVFSALLLAQEPADQYEVYEPEIRIVDLKLVGTVALTEAERAEMLDQLRQSVKYEGQFRGDELAERLRDQFQCHGFFKAQIGDVRIIDLSKTKKTRTVIIEAPVEEEKRFRLQTVGFQGGTVFDDRTLRAAVPMNDGDLFNVEKVREGIKTLRDLYGSRGYVNFTPVPDTQIDDERQVITVVFDLDEGEQFRFGKLTLEGSEPRPGIGDTLLEAWKPLTGQVYNARLLDATLKGARIGGDQSAGMDETLATALRNAGEFEWEANQDNDTHTMNFRLEFASHK